MFYTQLEGKNAIPQDVYTGDEGFVLAAAFDENGICTKAFGTKTKGEMGKCIPQCIGEMLLYHPKRLVIAIWNEETGKKMSPAEEAKKLCRLLDISFEVLEFASIRETAA